MKMLREEAMESLIRMQKFFCLLGFNVFEQCSFIFMKVASSSRLTLAPESIITIFNFVAFEVDLAVWLHLSLIYHGKHICIFAIAVVVWLRGNILR